MHALRIVSLIASATEMVAALGLADRLVGVSHECDWPPAAVGGRPVLTRAKVIFNSRACGVEGGVSGQTGSSGARQTGNALVTLPLEGATRLPAGSVEGAPVVSVTRRSCDIHADVQEIVRRGLGVYEIDVEALRAVRPTHIITQDQCEVCAVTTADVIRATQQCLGAAAHVITLHPDRLDDIFTDIRTVADGLGVPERGETLTADLRRAMARVAATARALLPRPRVVCLEWTDPLMVAGNWIPEMVAMAGGVNGITQVNDHTKVVEWQEIVAFDPEIILVMPCGYKIAQTLENHRDLEDLPGWAETTAVRRNQVYIIDGNTYMNRPGPRIVESFHILAGLFHPESFGHLIPPDSTARWP